MKPFVFLGSSLPVDAAREILDATYLPPVRQGDVLQLVAAGARIIVIIDGAFENTPSVWHNEILFAIEREAVVIGAASLGALRAAELWRYGMLGVGLIYRACRRGWIEDDDEVAVIHAPLEIGGWSVSEALVNIRMTCRHAVRAGVISAHQAKSVTSWAKRMHYKERSWKALLNLPEMEGALGRSLRPFSELVERNAIDQKAIDARRALLRAKRILDGARVPEAVEQLHVEPTAAWVQAVQSAGLEADGLNMPPRLSVASARD